MAWPWLSRTRSAICAPGGVSTCSMDVVREEFGPTDTGGFSRQGDSGQGAVVMHRFPRQDWAVLPGD